MEIGQSFLLLLPVYKMLDIWDQKEEIIKDINRDFPFCWNYVTTLPRGWIIEVLVNKYFEVDYSEKSNVELSGYMGI